MKKLLFSLSILTILIYGTHCLAAEPTAKAKINSKVKTHSKVNVARTINNQKQQALTFNSEADIYRTGTAANFSVNYVNDGWSVGLSMYNIQFIGPLASDNNFQKSPFINLSKIFTIDELTSVQIGTQIGTVLVDVKPRPLYNFNYLLANRTLFEGLDIQAGMYHANKYITNSVGTLGYIVGTEIVFIPTILTFQATYVSGHNNVSGANINLLYNVTNNIQPYIGVGVPEKNSGNEFYGIVGINLSFLNNDG